MGTAPHERGRLDHQPGRSSLGPPAGSSASWPLAPPTSDCRSNASTEGQVSGRSSCPHCDSPIAVTLSRGAAECLLAWDEEQAPHKPMAECSLRVKAIA